MLNQTDISSVGLGSERTVLGGTPPGSSVRGLPVERVNSTCPRQDQSKVPGAETVDDEVHS